MYCTKLSRLYCICSILYYMFLAEAHEQLASARCAAELPDVQRHGEPRRNCAAPGRGAVRQVLIV